MANWELQLLSSIIKSKEPTAAFRDARSKGITTACFSNPEALTLWSAITFHHDRPERYGSIPSEALLADKYSELVLPKAQEDLEDLVDLVKSSYLEKAARKAIAKFVNREGFGTSVLGGLADLTTHLRSLQEQFSSKSDKSFTKQALMEIMLDMDRIEENDGVTGIPFPWPLLNQELGGIQPGDLILIYALPKSMKTWIGLLICAFIALTGRTVLIYSREMTWETILRRIGCILAKVDYTRYKKNLLTMNERGRVLECMEFFQDSAGEIIFTDLERHDGTAGGPAEVREKIEIYKPEFVFLDSSYMLELPGSKTNPYDWRSLSVIMRELKQTAKSTLVPMVAVLQENERAALAYKGKSRGTASLAMNTGAIMDCDVAFRAVYNRRAGQISLHLPAGRETTFEGFTIWANAAENFGLASNKPIWDVGDDEDGSADDAPKVKEGETSPIEEHLDTYAESSMVEEFNKSDETVVEEK